MRAISDRKLPEPYRSWIDRAAPLPSGVRLLPRTIDVGTDSLIFLMLGTMMGGMGALFLLLPPWRFDPVNEGWQPYVFLAAICSALWSVPLVLLRRLFHTIRAHADLKRGTLRQGVLLGAEGMLVRMEPNRGHPIAAGRFVVAKLFPSETSRRPTLIIETLDGTVEFFAERLAAPPPEINRAARELWKSSKKSRRLVRADRKKLIDLRTSRKMHRAVYLFVGSALATLGAFGAVITVGDRSPAADAVALILFVGMLLLAGSAVNLVVRFLSLKVAYRCPECRGKPARLHEARPAVHFYCRACNVEWDTGLKEKLGA